MSGAEAESDAVYSRRERPVPEPIRVLAQNLNAKFYLIGETNWYSLTLTDNSGTVLEKNWEDLLGFVGVPWENHVSRINSLLHPQFIAGESCYLITVADRNTAPRNRSPIR